MNILMRLAGANVISAIVALRCFSVQEAEFFDGGGTG